MLTCLYSNSSWERQSKNCYLGPKHGLARSVLRGNKWKEIWIFHGLFCWKKKLHLVRPMFSCLLRQPHNPFQWQGHQCGQMRDTCLTCRLGCGGHLGCAAEKHQKSLKTTLLQAQTYPCWQCGRPQSALCSHQLPSALVGSFHPLAKTTFLTEAGSQSLWHWKE